MTAAMRDPRAEVLDFTRFVDAAVGGAVEDMEAIHQEVIYLAAESCTVGNPRYGSPGTPVDSGYALNQWMLDPSGGGATKPLGAPVPDGASSPYDKSGGAVLGEIAAAVPGCELGGVIALTNGCGYADVLEYEGHSAQAPGGWVRQTAAHAQQIVDDAARNVLGAGGSAPGAPGAPGVAA